jgi:hypothetical protein
MVDNGDNVEQETRARRRIRKAVEARGFRLVSLEYEPWYDAGEKAGIGGGWYGEMDRSVAPNIHPGNDIMGLSVEEVVANVDHHVPPPEPCECPEPEGFYLTQREPCHRHLPGCKWRLNYWLPWWGPKPKVSHSGRTAGS